MRQFTILFRLATDRRGVTAVEYALMGALISIAIAGTVTVLAGDITATLSAIGNVI